MKSLSVAIVGATGAVGRELMKLMDERGFEFSRIELVASKRSAGRKILWRGSEHTIKDLETFDFSGTDVAFFSAGTSTSKQWAGKAAQQGALVIDNTNAFRMDPLSPLVVPQVNAHKLAKRPASGIIANPNCSTIQMVRVLAPIERLYGIRKVVVSTYQAVSGGGLTGMEELQADSRGVLGDGPKLEPKRFPHGIGFNVVPQVDVFLESGFTLEEQKMLQESRKILELPDFALTATAVRVPVMNCHSEAVYIECSSRVNRDEILITLKRAEEVVVHDEQDPIHYPMPRFVSGSNDVHVGRIRVDLTNPKAFWCWIVADNLKVGAALNAIQIAERLPAEIMEVSCAQGF